MNREVKTGPIALQMFGGATSLDRMNIAHVTLVGVEVHYSGEPVVLQDVFFVNCTFVFDYSDRSSTLAEEIVSSRKVSFQS